MITYFARGLRFTLHIMHVVQPSATLETHTLRFAMGLRLVSIISYLACYCMQAQVWTHTQPMEVEME